MIYKNFNKSRLLGMSSRMWYGLFALIWLSIGILIWLYGHGWVRNYGGDVLVVGFMLWCVLVVSPTLDIRIAAILVFFIAIVIELSQFYELTVMRSMLGEKLSSLILGHSFDWLDILSYLVGLGLCFPVAQKAELRA